MPRRINADWFERLARSLTGVQGGEALLPNVLEDVRAALVLEDATEHDEWLFPMGHARVMQGLALAPSPGNVNQATLGAAAANPGVLAILERLWVNSNGALVTVGMAPADLADGTWTQGGVTLAFPMDTRLGDGRVTYDLFRRATPAVPGGSRVFTIPTMGTAAAILGFDQFRWPHLEQGAGTPRVLVANSTINQSLEVFAIWRERPLHKGTRG
jgi:hypothetical protein